MLLMQTIVCCFSVTSLTKFDSLFGCKPYPASKFASRALSEGLRREIVKKKQNVKISVVTFKYKYFKEFFRVLKTMFLFKNQNDLFKVNVKLKIILPKKNLRHCSRF